MENKNESRGRRKKYSIIEDVELPNKKTWFCDTCGRTMKLASKLRHLKSQKHKDNDHFFKFIMSDF